MDLVAAPSTLLRMASVLAVGLLLSFQAISPVSAAEPDVFSIPDEDGYGISECLQPGNACGHAMAESWCEAHGFEKALAYGMADDVTGSTSTGAKVVRATAGEVTIRCGH